MRIQILNRSIVAALRKFGVVATRLSSSPEGRLGCLLNAYGIEVVLDVGANIGQYAKMLRHELGYSGLIYSFEPMKAEFSKLKSAASGDPKWKVINCGLGDSELDMLINIAGNSASSSMLPASARLLSVAPQVTYVGTQKVHIRTLDAVYGELNLEGSRVYLKIDAQGFESKILAGSEYSLCHIDTVQLEMALFPMYEGALLYDSYLSIMRSKGYKLVHLIPGFWDRKTGELLEMDGIFHRS